MTDATLSTYTHEVLDYFAAKADAYDLVDEQVYWRLSDALLWELLETRALATLPEDLRFLDAGGGTGRWTLRVLEARPASRGTLFDLSPAMAAQARRKAEATGFGSRLETTIGDLDAPDALGDERFDLIFSFHNVLGFVRDPEAVVRRLAERLTPGGALALVVPNRLHTAFFNIAQGRLDLAEAAIDGWRSRFTDQMPDMHLFTGPQVAGWCEAAGLTVELETGFPTVVYPGYQETQLRGSSESVLGLLDDPERFARIHALERRLLDEDGLSARGNNLFVLGRAR